VCDHLGHPPAEPEPHLAPAVALTRRHLLRRGAGVLAAGVLLPGASQLVRGPAAHAGTSPGGRQIVPMAMHVHGSFSEGVGDVSASWETQLDQARLAGIQVVWPTDHDWRMSAYAAPDVFHTSALTETVNTRPYTWRPQPSGALATATARAVAQPASPADSAMNRMVLITPPTRNQLLVSDRCPRQCRTMKFSSRSSSSASTSSA